MRNQSDILSLTKGKWRQMKGWFSEQSGKRKKEPKLLLLDLFFMGCGFFFSRTHLVFGAYPLGIAWLCAVPFGVYTSLFGCIIGAFSMGKRGVVYALIDGIAVLLRLFLSGSESKSKAGAPSRAFGSFQEPPMLKGSVAVLSGFVGGGYEVLLSGLTLPGVLYAAVMMLASGVGTLLFSYMFAEDFPALFFARDGILPSFRTKNGVLFYLGFGAFLFLFGYALLPITFLGISLSFVYAGFVTLFFGFRYGGIYAMAVGFLCGISGSATAAVSFALCGAIAGFFCSFGMLYALLGGGGALVLWSGYTEGAVGFLSVFPEYAIAAALGFPLWQKLSGATRNKDGKTAGSSAEEMVGTMALSYQTKEEKNNAKISKAFGALSPLLRQLTNDGEKPDEEEYKSAVCEVLLHACYDCSHRDLCGTAGIQNLVVGLAKKSARQEPFTREDLSFCDKDDEEKDDLLYYLSLRVSDITAKRMKQKNLPAYSDLCGVFAKILEETQKNEKASHLLDTPLSEKLEKVFSENGMTDSVVRVYGEREKTILAAGEDIGGKKMTSPSLLASLEAAVGCSLGTPSYYRKNNMVLLSCTTKKKYKLATYIASKNRDDKEPSGDSARCFEEENGKYYLCLSDGMGSGKQAEKTSRFSTEYLQEMMSAGCPVDASLYLLNCLIRCRAEECSATLDMCEVDLYSGYAKFYKSGAAPSFLKRKDKVYRVRSQTVPLGILPTLDTEKIAVETKEGDIIIMFSDGVSTSPEDAPWLSGFLSGEIKTSLKEYSQSIVQEAEKHNQRKDDISVIVAEITAS